MSSRKFNLRMRKWRLCSFKRTHMGGCTIFFQEVAAIQRSTILSQETTDPVISLQNGLYNSCDMS